MKSRRLVLSGISGICISLAGCAVPITSSDKLEAGGLRIRNEHTLPHLIKAKITDQSSGLGPTETHTEFYIKEGESRIYDGVFEPEVLYLIEVNSGDITRDFEFRYDSESDGPNSVEIFIKSDGIISARMISAGSLN